MTGADFFERSRPSDPSRDFCLWPYVPPTTPQPGALRSQAILYHSFDLAGVLPQMSAIAQRIEAAAGRFNTVWGIKWVDGAPSWEFYFYDYSRRARRFPMADLIAALQGLVRIDVPVQDDLPYFMFSLDLTQAHAHGAVLTEMDIYIGTPGATVSAGLCYRLTNTGAEFRNIYFFFDAMNEQRQITDKLFESTHLSVPLPPEAHLIWPEMAGMQTVVVANKRAADGVYFSRITIDQLILGLERLTYPPEMLDFLRTNRALFAHHLFDMGYDFRMVGGAVRPVKGSFYGIL